MHALISTVRRRIESSANERFLMDFLLRLDGMSSRSAEYLILFNKIQFLESDNRTSTNICNNRNRYAVVVCNGEKSYRK